MVYGTPSTISSKVRCAWTPSWSHFTSLDLGYFLIPVNNINLDNREYIP